MNKEEFIKGLWVVKDGSIYITGINLKDVTVFIDTDVKKVILRNVETLAADDISGSVHLDKVEGGINLDEVKGSIYSKVPLKINQLYNFQEGEK